MPTLAAAFASALERCCGKCAFWHTPYAVEATAAEQLPRLHGVCTFDERPIATTLPQSVSTMKTLWIPWDAGLPPYRPCPCWKEKQA